MENLTFKLVRQHLWFSSESIRTKIAAKHGGEGGPFCLHFSGPLLFESHLISYGHSFQAEKSMDEPESSLWCLFQLQMNFQWKFKPARAAVLESREIKAFLVDQF